MMNSRLIGFPLLLAATACATGSNARPNLEPKNGPKANVYVYYTGGMTRRTVRTSFKVGQPAHVLVGRLGGDGRVEILYPETPRASSLVEPGKTYQAETFEASFDAVPRLFNYASRLDRSSAAKMSSYDGRGNGFVFVIATQYPMFTDALDDHGQWSDSLQAEGYWSAYDPRTAVKDFAEVLTRGMPYSLDFANAFTTTGYTGFADASIDCTEMIRAFGYVGTWYQLRRMGVMMPHMGGFGSFIGYGPFRDFMAIQPGCGFNSDRQWLDYMLPRRYVGINGGNWWWATQYNNSLDWWGRQTYYVPTPTGGTGPTTPSQPTKATFSTTSRRPGFRNGNESGPAFNVTRTRLDGQRNKPTNASNASHSWAPPIQETRTYVDRSDRSARVNGGNAGSSGAGGSGSSGAIGVTRTQGLTGTSTPAPVKQPAPAPLPHRDLGPNRAHNPDPPQNP